MNAQVKRDALTEIHYQIVMAERLCSQLCQNHSSLAKEDFLSLSSRVAELNSKMNVLMAMLGVTPPSTPPRA